MHGFLARNWWLLLLRGIVAVLFGILAIIWPGATLAVLIAFWAAYAFVDGCFALGTAISGSTHDDRWLLGLQGVIGISIGIITFFWPAVTVLGLLIAIAAWCLTVGVLQIAAAIRLRKEIKGEFWLGLSGVISIIFGLVMMSAPIDSIVALVWVLGIYAIIFGGFLIALAFRVKNHPLAV